MNKNNLQEVLSNKLKGYESTFRETSFDDDKRQYLCEDELIDVFDFDDFVKDNCSKTKRPSSPDAIYLSGQNFYFIEFKNSKFSSIKNKNMKNKMKHGTTIIKHLLKGVSLNNNKFMFYAVYRNLSSTKYFPSQGIESNIIRFGLKEMNKKLGNFYDKVQTNDVNFYKENFKDLKC